MSFLDPYNLEEIESGLINWNVVYNANLAKVRSSIVGCMAIVAGTALDKDDAFKVCSDKFARKAVADGSTLWPADGIIESTAISSGGSGWGRVFGKGTLVTTLSTIGYHYLSPSTPGKLTPTKPDTYVQPLIRALDLIDAIVRPDVFKVLEVDPTSVTTIKDKSLSNALAKGWEDHKALTYTQTPHGIVGITATDVTTIKNKLYSNYMVYLRDKAMSGDLEFQTEPSSLGTYASTLNAKAAGTYVQTLTLRLRRTGAGYIHDWFSGKFELGSIENCNDADIAAPTLSDTNPSLVSGEVVVTATYDTDAGVTKVYTPGDYVTMRVNTLNILGYTIPAVTCVDTIK